MAVAAQLSDKTLQEVVARVSLYEQLIEAAEPCFQIEGRRLEEVLKQHASNLLVYDTALQEAKAIEDLVKKRQDEVKSAHWKKYNENYSRQLNTRDIEAYIAGEPDYAQVVGVVLIVVEVKRKLEAIVNALTSLGWTLNNIVKLRVAQLDHVTM